MNTTVILNGSRMKFSAGHFTIFSEVARERLHGHNFTVECVIEAQFVRNEMAFDYGIFKKEIARRCESLDERLLLPGLSPHLTVEQRERAVYCWFQGEEMVFPSEDVRILPISNVTIEALALWFLEDLQQEGTLFAIPALSSVDMRVSSSPSQRGSVKWHKDFS